MKSRGNQAHFQRVRPLGNIARKGPHALLTMLSIFSIAVAQNAFADNRDSFRRSMYPPQREVDRWQREAEQQRREAERQRQEAERQTTINAQQQLQTSKTIAPQTTPARAGTPSNNVPSSGNKAPSKTDADNKNAGNSSKKTTSNADAADLSGPPATVEKLLQRWFTPTPPRTVPTPQQPLRSQTNHALTHWSTTTKALPAAGAKTAKTSPQAAPKAVGAVFGTTKTITGKPTSITQSASNTSSKIKHQTNGPASELSPHNRHTKDKARNRFGGRPPPIELNLPPIPQLLAINASPDMVVEARKLGFIANKPTRLSRLKFSVTKFDVPHGMGIGEARSLLRRQFPGTNFEFNRRYRIYRTATGVDDAKNPAANLRGDPTGCLDDRCFAPKIIGWKKQLKRCSTDTPIGIIDTSIDRSHPAFAGKKLEVAHFGRKEPAEPDWHGTGVAAILAGSSNSTTPGLIPDARFYLADAFHADEDGQPASDTMSMLQAFDWLEAKGVKIINMSFSGPKDELISDAIAKLSAKGVILVAAAGNDGPNAEPSYPAAYGQVVAVTAINKNLHSYRYANRGNYIDIAAPGVGIWTALPGARQGFHSGTSFAAPYITATLATIITAHPHLSGAQLLNKLAYQDLGAPGPDPVYGKGLVQAPTSCGAAGPIARASQRRAPLTNATAFAPATSSPEVLPWLGFNN